jgi:hypothetical protein
MPNCNYELRIINYESGCSENGKHLQKTMHYNTVWDGAAARARVSFFYLLTGMFLIAFVEKLMPDWVCGS